MTKIHCWTTTTWWFGDRSSLKAIEVLQQNKEATSDFCIASNTCIHMCHPCAKAPWQIVNSCLISLRRNRARKRLHIFLFQLRASLNLNCEDRRQLAALWSLSTCHCVVVSGHFTYAWSQQPSKLRNAFVSTASFLFRQLWDRLFIAKIKSCRTCSRIEPHQLKCGEYDSMFATVSHTVWATHSVQWKKKEEEIVSVPAYSLRWGCITKPALNCLQHH